jgi:hypothetical protein
VLAGHQESIAKQVERKTSEIPKNSGGQKHDTAEVELIISTSENLAQENVFFSSVAKCMLWGNFPEELEDKKIGNFTHSCAARVAQHGWRKKRNRGRIA